MQESEIEKVVDDEEGTIISGRFQPLPTYGHRGRETINLDPPEREEKTCSGGSIIEALASRGEVAAFSNG